MKNNPKDLKQVNEFQKAKEVSIIGKSYKPYDNSWQLNISQHDRVIQSDYLAGVYNDPAKTVTIQSEPFDVNVFWMGKYRLCPFIIVADESGDSHLTLYREDCIL